MKKEKNLKEKKNKKNDVNTNKNIEMNETKHIEDFTSSREIGEDATQYGEFISSFFDWVSLDKQKEETRRLENITKDKT